MQCLSLLTIIVKLKRLSSSSKPATHSIQSPTPLVWLLILFLRNILLGKHCWLYYILYIIYVNFMLNITTLLNLHVVLITSLFEISLCDF